MFARRGEAQARGFRFRRLIAGVAAVVLGIGALTLGTLGAGASPAQAAPNSGIVVGGVTITPADTQATVGDTLRVDGTWDASEANP